MPIDMDSVSREVLNDIEHGRAGRVDQNQQEQIIHLTKHVRALWRHVERLEKALSVDPHSITLQVGNALVKLKLDGTVDIKGKDITLDGSGKVNVKAGGDVVLKGAKIRQN